MIELGSLVVGYPERGETLMAFEGFVELIGRTRDDKETLFEQKISVSSETFGGLLDALVEASYDLYYSTNLWLIENRESDYALDSDHWFLTVGRPALSNPYHPELGNYSGASVSDTLSIVQTVAHDRHLDISNFVEGEIKYLRDGYYRHYVEGMRPLNNFYDVFYTRDVQFFRNYGYTGIQLDTLLSDMGPEYINYLKSLQAHRKILARGSVDKLVLPREVKELYSRPRGGFLRRITAHLHRS